MKKFIAPLSAGLLVAASMPPWGWWPLAFLGLAWYASLAWANRETLAFSTAFVFSLGWFLPTLSWMWFLTIPGYFVAVAIFATLHGAGALLARRLSNDQQSHAHALLICHTAVEALRLSWPFGGVPIATLAIGQSQSPLAALSPLGGVILLTFATMWLAFSQKKFRALIAVVLLIGLANLTNRVSDNRETRRIAFVQGGGEQGTRAVYSDPREVFDRHIQATQLLQPDSKRDMVIWPENVVNVTSMGLFVDNREYTDLVEEAKRLNVPFVVGITEDAGRDSFMNAQVVIEPDGTISSRYDKVRRVPFGEYMPMRRVIEAMGAPTHLVPRDARAGDARAWVDVANTRAAVAISWEIFFGGRVNEGVVDGATFIINPTNGSSYTGTILQSQQVAASRLRAREQSRWLVQVAPTGFSEFVSPNGEVFDRVGITRQGVVERTISLRTGRTVYSRLGNSPYIVALLALAAVLLQRRTRDIR